MRGRPLVLASLFSIALLLAHLVLGVVDGSFSSLAPKAALAQPVDYYAAGFETGGPWGGVQAMWDVQDVYAPNWVDGAGALQAVWGFTILNPPIEYVQVGYVHGWLKNTKRFFWAESVAGWGYAAYDITSPTPTAIGTKHQFSIEQTGMGPAGQVIFKVYIDEVCVEASDGCESWQNPGRWVVKMEVGAEDARAPQGHYATVGPTHASYMLRRATDSGNWFNWVPTGKYVDAPNDSFFEYYGDYTRAVYGMGIQYRDPFEGPDGSDPNWPKTTGYWSESGGNIFIHQVPNNWSHLHMDYSNPGGYLLMRRDKNDTNPGSPLVLEFGFGDDMASQAGHFFGVWSGSSQMAIGVNTGYDPTWSPNYYFYRTGSAPVFINTNIARYPSAWHIFRFYITSSGCSYGELDGTSLAYLGTNCSITPGTLQTWGVASTWGLTSVGIWDNAVYFHR